MNKRQQARAAIVEACPELVVQSAILEYEIDMEFVKPIRLSHVLRAVDLAWGKKKLYVKRVYLPLGFEQLMDAGWNLEKDSLSEASDECINFLHEILCK